MSIKSNSYWEEAPVIMMRLGVFLFFNRLLYEVQILSNYHFLLCRKAQIVKELPPKVVDNYQTEILLDFKIQTDKMAMANQQDIEVIDNQQRKTVVINLAIRKWKTRKRRNAKSSGKSLRQR